MKNLTIIIIIALLYSSVVFTTGKKDIFQYSPRLQIAVMQTNNINTKFWNNGMFNMGLKDTLKNGLIWPVTANTALVADFTTGLWIGAKVGQQRELRLAAALYNSHYSPGNIPINGQVPPHSVCDDPSFKVYLVNLVDTALVNGGTRSRVAGGQTYFINYDSWASWPVAKGAPYVEVNNIAGYQPGWNSDRPGIGNSNARPNEISFAVYMDYTNCTNDLHYSELSLPGGTLPLGAEIHQITFAFNCRGLGDMYFIKWKVFNKSALTWDSTFLSIVDDADIGDAYDDAAGCDTLRQMGFIYNLDNDDLIYGSAPPATAYRMLQSPLIHTANPADTAKLPYGTYIGYKLKGMTVYNTFRNGGNECDGDPDEAFRAYYFMQGKNGCAEQYVNPVTNHITTYMYSGNSCNRNGWIESVENDRRQMLSTGPIVMSSGDTQTVMAAVMVSRGSNNFQSVCGVQYLSDTAKTCYDYNFMFCPDLIGIDPLSSEVPDKYMLYQNYPNPFNPATKIKFSIPVGTHRGVFVQLNLYDVLGRQIATLVNEELQPGTYEIEWGGTNLSSGIYYYKLVTENFMQTRKMVLLK